jgi:hypothetical protein
LNRRQWFALTGLALASACRSRKGTGFPGYALIASAGDHSLTAVDLIGFRIAKMIPLNAAPSSVLLGSAGQCYILTPSTGSVHMLGPELRIEKSRKLADAVSAMCLSPDGKLLVAIAPSARELIALEAASLKVMGRYKLAAEPAYVSAPPAAKRGEPARPPYVAVSSGRQRTVELLDYSSGKRSHYEFPGPIGLVRFRADGERLLVANLQERCITAMTTPDLQVLADLPLPMLPQNVCFNADQGQLFVSGEGMDAVAIIFPYNPLDVDQTVLAGPDPGVMACADNPAYLFVGSNSGPDVSILNIDTRHVIGIVDAGQRATYITVTPDSQYALVLSESAGTMAVIHIPDVLANTGDPALKRNKVTAGLFTLLQVGSRPVDVAVVPRAA